MTDSPGEPLSIFELAELVGLDDQFEGGEDAHLEMAYEDRFAIEDYEEY